MSYTPSRLTPPWLDGRGAGGAWKQSPDDFVVEELPLVEPTGEGEHQWLRVRKVNRTTPEVVRALAEAAGVSPDAVGYAGMKDRVATTTQDFTVQLGRPIEALPEGVQILARAQTRRRLRVGQLRGNRFTLRIVGGDPAVARERLARLQATGMPNYYGVQRVGGDAPLHGRAILGGGGPRLRYDQLKFALSAWQSVLFNRVLATRGPARLAGDLVTDAEPSADQDDRDGVHHLRVSADPTAETGTPTGPMYGPHMRWPEGEALALERRVLAEERLPDGALERFSKFTGGTRRRLVVPVRAEVEPTEGGFWLRFELPAGSYATVLLEELL